MVNFNKSIWLCLSYFVTFSTSFFSVRGVNISDLDHGEEFELKHVCSFDIDKKQLLILSHSSEPALEADILITWCGLYTSGLKHVMKLKLRMFVHLKSITPTYKCGQILG